MAGLLLESESSGYVSRRPRSMGDAYLAIDEGASGEGTCLEASELL